MMEVTTLAVSNPQQETSCQSVNSQVGTHESWLILSTSPVPGTRPGSEYILSTTFA